MKSNLIKYLALGLALLTIIAVGACAKPKEIVVDGVIDEWSARAVMIADPSEDVAGAASKKGVDLKALYALMDENYLYAAIEVYDVFDPSLLRNYFIDLDLNKDGLDDYIFGIRPDGTTWVFDPAALNIARQSGNLTAKWSPDGVKCCGKGSVIEVRIERKYYEIPSSILICARVTEGGPDVDRTDWREVSTGQGE
jgi:hypothetical protein